MPNSASFGGKFWLLTFTYYTVFNKGWNISWQSCGFIWWFVMWNKVCCWGDHRNWILVYTFTSFCWVIWNMEKCTPTGNVHIHKYIYFFVISYFENMRGNLQLFQWLDICHNNKVSEIQIVIFTSASCTSCQMGCENCQWHKLLLSEPIPLWSDLINCAATHITVTLYKFIV